MRVIHLKRSVSIKYDGLAEGIWDVYYSKNNQDILIGTIRADEETPAKDLQELVTFLLTWQEKQGRFPPSDAKLG